MTSALPLHPKNLHATHHRPPRRHEPAATLASTVGNTPVLRVTAPFADGGRGFWAKLEGSNPGGIKDRTALHLVGCARARGDLRPGARIIESSSGTLGLGLALAGMAYRHPVTVVTDTGLEPIIARMLTAYGVRVEQVTEPHPRGGWQQARCDRVAQLLAEDPVANRRNPASDWISRRRFIGCGCTAGRSAGLGAGFPCGMQFRQ
jgi:cysteine synthase